MAVRGTRRRRAIDRGFTVSDHVDWPSLLAAIDATGAQRIWATHGYTSVLVRWLEEHGVEARALETRYEGERDDPAGDDAGGDEPTPGATPGANAAPHNGVPPA
jgi:putative mRNA 3-end processing factor